MLKKEFIDVKNAAIFFYDRIMFDRFAMKSDESAIAISFSARQI